MNNALMTALAAAATDMTFGERAAYSGRMLLIGMLMVFSVLALLWGVLAISKVLFYDIPARRVKNKNDAVKKPQETVASPAAASSTRAISAAAPANDGAIVAAITAAIAAARADEGCTTGFHVVSFRRADNGRAWNRK